MQINRLQNKINYWIYDTNTKSSEILFSDTISTFFNEPPPTALTFINAKNDFIYFSERRSFKHLWKGSILKNKSHIQLTDGNFEVSEIAGYNSRTQTIYFLSNEKSPLESNLFSISLDGKNKRLLLADKGTHEVIFSANCQYFINYFSSNTIPLRIAVYNNSGQLIKVLIDNKELTQKIESIPLPTKEFFSFKSSDSLTLYGGILKPINFSMQKKYPVLFYVYGGPGVQIVKNLWNIQWYYYLTTHDLIVVSVDNRGTAGRGKLFESQLFHRIGTIEVADQLAAANYLSKFPYIDTSRINIFGWSYGGYLSAMCLLKGNGKFKNAIAIALPTDWLLCDAAYTERYMGLPSDNAEGYQNSSLLHHVSLLSGNLLLIHGTADDNVHLQHTLIWTEKLVQHNKQFEMLIYTDKNHRITVEILDIICFRMWYTFYY